MGFEEEDLTSEESIARYTNWNNENCQPNFRMVKICNRTILYSDMRLFIQCNMFAYLDTKFKSNKINYLIVNLFIAQCRIFVPKKSSSFSRISKAFTILRKYFDVHSEVHNKSSTTLRDFMILLFHTCFSQLFRIS